MELFFNELSVTPANSEKEADYWIRSLVDNCLGIRKIENRIALISSYNSFGEIILLDNYNFLQSMNKLEKDKRDLFLSLANKSPAPKNPPKIKLNPQFTFNDSECIGLAHAYINDSISISFPSDTKWDSDIIIIDIYEYMEESGALEKYDGEVKHISRSEHLDKHTEWIKKFYEDKLKNTILDFNGKELWEHKELFTNLIFCDSVKNQLIRLSSNSVILRQIKNKLLNLNKCFDEVLNNPQDIYKKIQVHCGKFTPESNTRINQFKERLTFKCPDNESRLFSYHLRYTPNAGRIYVNIEIDSNKCFVGYIGKKIT